MTWNRQVKETLTQGSNYIRRCEMIANVYIICFPLMWVSDRSLQWLAEGSTSHKLIHQSASHKKPAFTTFFVTALLARTSYPGRSSWVRTNMYISGRICRRLPWGQMPRNKDNVTGFKTLALVWKIVRYSLWANEKAGYTRKQEILSWHW